MVDKITISIDETLELDYSVERISSEAIDITKPSENDPTSIDYISTETGIFNPQRSGTYQLDVNGQTIEIDVIRIPSSALNQRLEAWYRFEDGDARDYTATLEAKFADSTAYDGTVNGATYKSNAGVTDFANNANSGAFDFSSGDTISAESYDFDMSSSWSVSIWFNSSSSTESNLVGDGVGGSNDKWGLFVENGDLTLHTGTGNQISRILSTSINTNQWYHAVVTFDGGSSWGLYLDGSEVGSESQSPYNNGTGLIIGANSSQSANGDRRIDDVRVYDKVLSSTEVSDIYNETKP